MRSLANRFRKTPVPAKSKDGPHHVLCGDLCRLFPECGTCRVCGHCRSRNEPPCEHLWEEVYGKPPVHQAHTEATEEKPYVRDAQPKVLPNINLETMINTMLVACEREGVDPHMADERVKGERMKWIIHASQISKCAAKVFFGVIGVGEDQDTDPRTMRIFGNGHAVHRRVQGYLIEVAKRGIGGVTDYWENVRIEVPELGIVGELDFILEFQHKFRYLVEIKSKNTNSFDEMKKPEQAWVYQGHCYMHFTGINQSIYLVENKNNQAIKEPKVPWQDVTWAELATVCHEVNDAVDTTGQIPSVNISDCYWCDYRATVCPKYGKSPQKKKIDQLVQIARFERSKR